MLGTVRCCVYDLYPRSFHYGDSCVVNLSCSHSPSSLYPWTAFGGISLAAGNDNGGGVLFRWPLFSRNAMQSSNMTSRDGVLYTRMWAFATSSTWTYPIRPSFPKSLPPAGPTSMFKCKLGKTLAMGMFIHNSGIRGRSRV